MYATPSHPKWPTTTEQIHDVASKHHDVNLVAFWLVRKVPNAATCNSEFAEKSMVVKVGTDQVTVNIPIITNTKMIRTGEEIICHAAEPCEFVEPPSKKARVADENAKSKGKGSSKGNKKKAGK